MFEDDDIDFTAKDAARATKSGLWIVAVVAVVLVATYAIWAGVQQSFIPWQGKIDQQRQTTGNGSYRIAQYDHFFDLCAQVQTDEASIANLQAELKGPPKPDAQRREVIATSITALRNNRADDINQYNADARKADTAGHFRDSHLPYQLDVTAKETTCTSN